MNRALLVMVVVSVVVGCKKHEAQPVPVTAPATVTPPVDEATFKAKHTLTSAAKGSGFELTDGTGEFHITLPSAPKLQADMMAQSGVQVFNAQAVMAGGDVDVQFGAMTVPDGDLPSDLSQLDTIPQQLASATSGTVAKNEAGVLAGIPARVFEVTTGDKRRLFGWYVLNGGHAQVFQINCIGDDNDKTRAACGVVASSFGVSKSK